MQSFTGVEFNSKPNEINIYKTAVDVVTSCVETEKTDEQTGDTKVVYICDVNRYSLQEYIYFQQSNYENALNVANAANDTANQALEIAKTTNEYAEAGAIMLGEV